MENPCKSYLVYEKARNAKGMSDYAVSQKTGISAGTISSWKNNLYVPKIDKLILIANTVGIDVKELIGVG